MFALIIIYALIYVVVNGCIGEQAKRTMAPHRIMNNSFSTTAEEFISK
jgi:hypothetical protein